MFVSFDVRGNLRNYPYGKKKGHWLYISLLDGNTDRMSKESADPLAFEDNDQIREQ